MSRSKPIAANVKVLDHEIVVDLADGRVISAPLSWFPRLSNATARQRAEWSLIGQGEGIRWPELDEDLSVEGLLRGAPAPRAKV
jgi:hypothetical protein